MTDYTTQDDGSIHFVLKAGTDDANEFLAGKLVTIIDRQPRGDFQTRTPSAKGDVVRVELRDPNWRENPDAPPKTKLAVIEFYNREQRGEGKKRPHYNYLYALRLMPAKEA